MLCGKVGVRLSLYSPQAENQKASVRDSRSNRCEGPQTSGGHIIVQTSDGHIIVQTSVATSLYRHQVATSLYTHQVATSLYAHQVATSLYTHQVATSLYAHQVAISLYKHQWPHHCTDASGHIIVQASGGHIIEQTPVATSLYTHQVATPQLTRFLLPKRSTQRHLPT